MNQITVIILMREKLTYSIKRIRFTGLNIIIDNSDSVVEVVSVFIGANLIQLFTD